MIKLTLGIIVSLLTLSLAANPVSTPIIRNAGYVFVRRFAQIPREDGKTPRINAMVRRGYNLYVSTDTSGSKIYRVTRFGKVNLWFDVQRAVKIATNRSVDDTNFIHGGLRSLAFHPQFSRNGFIYTSYMETRPEDPENFEYLSDVDNPIPADSVVVEWKYNSTTKMVDPMSYRQVIRIGMPVYDHPIKQIAFQGQLLYISHGDGSVQSAIAGGGQKNDGLGKILRIKPLRSGKRPYTIPRDNPFAKSDEFLSEIYALGFRNPHHICFSSKGELIAADTGRDNVEEVNIVVSGANYGWAEREGTFVHKMEGGGIVNGIAPLPANDSLNEFRYPVIQVGHEGPEGGSFSGEGDQKTISQAIAGGCPVENGSPLDGLYFYADFPVTGNLYFSYMDDMRSAKVTGNPSQLTQAKTFQPQILFDDDDDPYTPPILLENLGDVVRSEPGMENTARADIRFGRGSFGEMYFSSKRTSLIYLVENSLPVTSRRKRQLIQLKNGRFTRPSE